MTTRHDTQDSADYERPSAWSSGVSNVGTLIVTGVMVGGIWWWTVGATQSQPDGSPKTADSQPADVESQNRSTNVRSSNGDEKTEPVVQAPSANGETPANPTQIDDLEFDASRTSWQDPFTASHWESDGWTFQPEAMQSRATKSATAKFRRDYRKITIACRCAPLGEAGVFQIRLFAPTTDALVQAEFSREMIKVYSTIRRKTIFIKQRRYPVPFVVGKPTTLWLTANGSRVLISCNGKRVINCRQPVELSGKPLQFSLHTDGGAFRISSLRLEGE
jgi:hypothetical protein